MVYWSQIISGRYHRLCSGGTINYIHWTRRLFPNGSHILSVCYSSSSKSYLLLRYSKEWWSQLCLGRIPQHNSYVCAHAYTQVHTHMYTQHNLKHTYTYKYKHTHTQTVRHTYKHTQTNIFTFNILKCLQFLSYCIHHGRIYYTTNPPLL